jgi:N-acetylglucosaminyldiphosphoundecaprenol N-acetyl-beta-D-mannosaminyltransferase
MDPNSMPPADGDAGTFPPPAWVWGLPLTPLTGATLPGAVAALIAAGRPAYFITANLNYAMLTHRHGDLADVNRGAAFIVADGWPLVWASRRQGTPLPERVAGSDFVFTLCRQAADLSHRVFLLGGAPGVGEEAAAILRARFPGLQVVGVEAPPFREPTPEEHAALVARIRDARPDLLLVAFGQPKGERWLHAHHRELGVPAGVQVGASLDFVAGRVRRAPRWLQRGRLEWAYRLALEPRRLAGRYWQNGLFLLRMTAQRSRHRGGYGS